MKDRTHIHEFLRRADGFEGTGKPDYFCRLCGWRIPAALIGAAVNAGATVVGDAEEPGTHIDAAPVVTP